MQSSDQPDTTPDTPSAAGRGTVPTTPNWLIPQALRKLPSLKYALGIAAIMALLALGKAAFSSPGEAIFGAAAMIGLMCVLVVFNWLSRSGPSFLHAPATALIWAIVVLFIVSATATVTSVFLDLPKPFPDLMRGINGKAADMGDIQQHTSPAPQPRTGDVPAANPLTNAPGSVATPASGIQSPVPVTIQAVYRETLSPASHTILTVRAMNGNLVRSEMIPNPNGEVSLELHPGQYTIAAIGGGQPIGFEVLPPRTQVTIQIDGAHLGLAPIASETITLDAGSSADAIDRQVFVSLIAIDFGGTPLRHRVSFVVGGRGIPNKTYQLTDVGTICVAGKYEVRVQSAGTFQASFVVTRTKP